MDRRQFMKGALGLTGSGLLLGNQGVAKALIDAEDSSVALWNLAPKEREVMLSGFGPKGLPVKAFDYGVSVLRSIEGQMARVSIRNELQEPTTLHWHGLMLPAYLSGMPSLNGKEYQAGERSAFNILTENAGTYWVHPRINDINQIRMGLLAPLIVGERYPYDADVDEVVVFKDWAMELDENNAPSLATAKSIRLGHKAKSFLTANNSLHVRKPLPARSRVRLRLINASSGRSVVIANPFQDRQKVWVIARDGNPVIGAVQEAGKSIVIAAGQRVDVVFDMPEQGKDFILFETNNGPREILTYSSGEPILDRARPYPADALPPTTRWLPTESEMKSAPEVVVELKGGSMEADGEAGGHHYGLYWTANGKSVDASYDVAEFKANRPARITFLNNTYFDHPMHIHGVSGIVSDGSGTFVGDTVLVKPGGSATIDFIPTELGRWAIQCYLLENSYDGLSGSFAVS